MVPDATTAASGGCLLFAQYWPFAILKPKNPRRTYADMPFVIYPLSQSIKLEQKDTPAPFGYKR
jgi:hypothetical protein